MIPAIGKSTLLGFRYQLVGFLFMDNPMNCHGKVEVTFFKQDSSSDLYLICLSEVTKDQAKTYAEILKNKLGEMVAAEEVIPYVQRSLGDVEYEAFQGLMEASFALKIEWSSPTASKDR